MIRTLNKQSKLVFTLLVPELQLAVDDFYSDYLSDIPIVSNYSGRVISINESENGFSVTLGVSPYLGPHDPVGYDEVVFFIDNIGTIMKTKFNHKKNFEIPKNLNVIIKKPIPIS